MIRFSADSYEPQNRLEGWSGFVKDALAPFRLEPAGECSFNARIGQQKIGALSVIAAEGEGYRGARSRSEIARTREHFYVAAIHVGGETSVRYGDEERGLARGDLFFLDTMHEFELGMESPYAHLLVSLPKDWIEARLPHARSLCGSVLPSHNPLVRIFATYLSDAYSMADRLPPGAALLFSQQLLELLYEALAGVPSGSPRAANAVRDAAFLRARRLITLRSSDPTLSPDRIAKDLGITTRMLHRAFAAHGESVMHFVQKERLHRAARLLADPGARHRTITEISFACGFNDLSHFGRAFADRYGVTPSQWRSDAH